MNPTIRVLVVDDEESIRDAVVDLLTDAADIEVVGTATSGIEALGVLATVQADVVLMDLRMPEMDGIETTNRITEAGIKTSVLIHSAYDDDSLVLEALQAGGHGYVLKGSPKSDLLSAMRMVAEGGAHISDEVTRPLIDKLVRALNVERKTRLAAEALNARQKTFSLQAAHELRTPLTGLIGSLELLVDGDVEDALIASLHKTALQSAHRLRRLAENLEVTASGETLVFEFESVEVGPAVVEVIRASPNSGDIVTCDFPPGLRLWSDRKRLQQVVDNLLQNAISVSPKGSEVSICGRKSGDDITIDVSDHGAGFSEESLASLCFEPFTIRDGAAQGMGLGVYVVGKVLQRLDASMTATKNEHGGTTVHLLFSGGSR